MKRKQLILEQEIKAIEMRFKGVPMKEIAKIVGVAYPTVRGWFMRGGRLHEHYMNYLKDQQDLRLEESKKILRMNLKNATVVLANSLKSLDEKIKLAAAKEIINRELGEPIKRITDETDDVVSRILKEVGVLKDDDKRKI